MAATKSRPWGNVKPPAGSTVDWGDPISRGLVSLMLFNEMGPTRFYDMAAPRNGQCTNGATSMVGAYGNEVSFDGSNDYILMSSGMPSTVTNVGPKSVSAVLTIRSSASTGQRIMYHSIGGVQFAVFYSGSYSPSCYLDGANALTTNASFSFGVTYHMVFTWNGTSTLIYVNGVAQSTTGAVTSFSPANYTIGGRSDVTRTMDGSISCLRIHNRALSQNEAMRYYTEPFAGITEPRLRLRSGSAAVPATKYFFQAGSQFYGFQT